MTRNILAGAACLALLALAATAQAVYDPDAPPCPEDRYCILDAPAEDGNSTQVQPEQGFGNGTGACGGADRCPGTIQPCADKPEGAVCNEGGTATGTCMDGQQGSETCDPDVYYFVDGPADSGPSGGNATHERGDEDARTPTGPKAVPGLGAALVVGAVGAVAVGLGALRRR
ncbi:MAG: hypothetical protein LC624_05250 [Halobacteriales archaeon]|nr:hypothetical protein [Halobacteriales archaeon]